MDYSDVDANIYALHEEFHDGAFVNRQQCRVVLSIVDMAIKVSCANAIRETPADPTLLIVGGDVSQPQCRHSLTPRRRKCSGCAVCAPNAELVMPRLRIRSLAPVGWLGQYR